jgi:complex III assembly factor LYRM7
MATVPALNAYRHLMRAARIAFQGTKGFMTIQLPLWPALMKSTIPNDTNNSLHTGDTHILSAAQLQIRNEFRQKASIDAPGATAAIQHAEEVAKVLRENVVQGKKTEEGKDTYSKLDTVQSCTCHGQRP